MRSAIKLLLLLAGLVICISLMLRSNSVSAGEKGNETKGKYYFKQTCKTCHAKDAKGGEVTPLTKTMAQWQIYFKAGKHARGTETLTKLLTAEQLRDVETFLVAHAADSPQPETCGK